MAVDFKSYAPFFKKDYIPKALDTLVYSDQFLNRIKKYPLTEGVVGNKTVIPFDLRRLNSVSSTFSHAQALAKLDPASDQEQQWEMDIVDGYSIVRVTEKLFRAAAGDEGAIFKIITNAGNKCLAALRLKLLTDIFTPVPGISGVVLDRPQANAFRLKDNSAVSNFEKGDQIEFRTAAGVKKGTGFHIVKDINLLSPNIQIATTINMPALADGDYIYHRGNYGQTHLTGLGVWLPETIIDNVNRTVGGINRGPTNRSIMSRRKLYGNFRTMTETEKFYEVILEECGKISALTKSYPTIAVMHPMTYKSVMMDLRDNQRTGIGDSPEGYLGYVCTHACPTNLIYLLDELCMGFHFLPSVFSGDGISKKSITPEQRWMYSQGVEKFSDKGVNLVDFEYAPNGSFAHTSPDDEGVELRAAFHGAFVYRSPGTASVIKLHSSKVPTTF